MANTTPIIHKRTFVSGRLPSTNPANTRYINPGELSINLTDKKVISSNGSVLFEIGANITTSSITTLVANGTPGTPGQTLSSNGSSIYWTDNAGFTGSQGIQGDKGYTGSNGVIGYTGSNGVIGYTGSNGVIGYTGSKGEIGVIGFVGSQGIQGYTGSQGITGFTGSNGVTGFTGSNGVIGFTGSQGIQGIIGFTGSQGVIGYTGSQGVIGFTGSQGIIGYTGSQGIIGFTGSNGVIGYTGSNGVTGYAGSLGYTGSKGDTGSFGGASFDYTFSSNTVNTDPGSGVVKFNTANLASASVMYISFLDSTGANSYNYLTTIDDSTSAIKGNFNVVEAANSLNFSQFSIVGNHSHTGNYFEVPIAWLSGGYSFANNLSTVATFTRTGDKGDTGFTGSQGIQGAIGYTGSQGIQGVIGYTGSNGVTGFTGSQGVIGYTGSNGVTGYTGSNGVIGFTGSQGVIGYTGSNGVTGFTGSNGVIGFTGSQGVIGYTGSAGPVAGTNQQVIFNDAGAANGSTSFVYDKSLTKLTVNNAQVQTKLNVGNPVAFDFGATALVELDGQQNTFVQVVIQNANTGINASSDLVVTNDSGNNTFGYIDLGINSTNYSNANYTVVGAGDGYLYASDTSLSIGTKAARPVIFHANGTLIADEAMRIAPSRNVGIANTAPADKLSVGGSTNIQGTLDAGNTTITGFANVSTTLTVGGIATFNSNVNLSAADHLILSNTSSIVANGTFGSSGDVLTSNGSGSAYWAAGSGGGGGFTPSLGQVVQSTTAPTSGTWLQTGKYYSKASYSALAAALGDVPDIGAPVAMPKAQIPVPCSFTNTGGRALYSMATSGTAWVFGTTQTPRIIYTTDGTSFSAVPPNASISTITGIRYVNNQFVATTTPSNNGATLLVSPDGINWSARTMQASASGGTTSANSIAYGAGVYVIAYSGAILYSTDLITFTQAAPATLTAVYLKVIYAGGQFVAVSSTGAGSIITSPDGINWTTQTNPISCAYQDVIYANSLYVAYGNISTGNVVTSPNGITWTSRSVGASNVVQVVYGGGIFLAATLVGIHTSTDGLTWAMRATNIPNAQVLSVGYVGSTFYAGGSTDGLYATSADGTTWTLKRDASGGGIFAFHDVNGKAVAIGDMGIVVLAGGTREAYQPGFTIAFNVSLTTGGRQVAYNGSNQYVMVSSRGLPLYSSDGNSWTATSLTGTSAFSSGNCIAYLNGNYLIGGGNSTASIATSTNGIDWTVRTTPTTTGINKFAYGAGVYVAVGNSGNIFSSPNLATWTSRAAGAQAFGDVIFDNGQFVAVGAAGACYTSSDGLTWTTRSAGSTQFYKVIWAAGTINLFVAIGVGGLLYTSPDGTTWTSRSAGSATFSDIAFDSTNNVLVLVGLSGTVYTSTNGTTWTNRTLGVNTVVLGNVIYDGTQWLAFILTQNGGGYFKSINSGVTWVRVAFPDEITMSRVVYLGGKYIRLAPNYISLSSDGVTWRSADQVTYRTSSFNTLQKINDKYFAAAIANYPIVYTSSDGITFTPSRTAVHGYITYDGSAYINVYINSTGPVGVYRSTDGDTWTHYADVSQSTDTSTTRVFKRVSSLTDIAYASGKLTFFTGSAAVADALNTQTVYYSSDGGLTWSSGNFPAGQQAVGPSGTDGTTLVVGAANYGVYKTTDGGATWLPIYGIGQTATSVVYTGGYWYWSSFHTPDASNIISGPSQTITALGTYNGYGFNINGSSGLIWKASDNMITPYSRLSLAIPGNIGLAVNSKETPVRASDTRALALGSFASTAATVVNAIVEYPLFSYNTSTTFFVPQHVVGLATNEYIYAGA